MSTAASPSRVYDALGIGFGPSGLALAAAAHDVAPDLDMLFFDRKGSFSWHEGMLLPGARMQVSCLKDLATLRDPCSQFTFLNYLHRRGSLDEFINLGGLRPGRLEFDAYLRWAAERVGHVVRYEREAVGVSAIHGSRSGEVVGLEVRVRNLRSGAIETYLTHSVVLGAGSVPRIPENIRTGDRIFHSDVFLQAIDRRFSDERAAWRFVVVGDGQSGAEVFDYLASRYPNARVTAAIRGFGYRPMDETPFVNEAFFPSSVDVFYDSSEPRRAELLATLKNTNYAVVDIDLIERIYRRLYDAKVSGRTSLEIRRLLELASAVDEGDRVTVTFDGWLDGREVRMEADALVLATGYRAPNPHPLLSGLSPYLCFDEGGRYRTARNYRVEARTGFAPGVFLQGYCETTHGIGETLLSVAAIRAGEIAGTLRSEKALRSRDGMLRAARDAEGVPARLSGRNLAARPRSTATDHQEGEASGPGMPARPVPVRYHDDV